MHVRPSESSVVCSGRRVRRAEGAASMTGWTAPAPSAHEPAEVSRLDRQRFAAQWAHELMGTSYVPMSTSEVEGRMLGYTDRLVDALLSEPFDPSDAHAVG